MKKVERTQVFSIFGAIDAYELRKNTGPCLTLNNLARIYSIVIERLWDRSAIMVRPYPTLWTALKAKNNYHSITSSKYLKRHVKSRDLGQFSAYRFRWSDLRRVSVTVLNIPVALSWLFQWYSELKLKLLFVSFTLQGQDNRSVITRTMKQNEAMRN